MLSPIEFVTVLAMILEKIFKPKLPDGIFMSKSEIVERLRRAGKSTTLQSVGENFYQRACRGEAATLGAYALAYMAALDDEAFAKFTAANLHELVAELANLRGHTNNLSLTLTEDELVKLREKVFAAIKFLGG